MGLFNNKIVRGLLWPFVPARDQTPPKTGDSGPSDPAREQGATGPVGGTGPIRWATGPVGGTGPIRWATGPIGSTGVRATTQPVFPRDPDAPPLFAPLVSNEDRARVFGRFDYEPNPLPGNPEHVRITGSWEHDNIIWVDIPQLNGVKGAEHRNNRNGMLFHKRGEKQLQGMFRDWEKAGLLDRVISFDGSFVPRFVRGSRTVLSNHAFGNAFDINCEANPMGQEPARLGAIGCVRELVPFATKWGFYWGGFYHQRRDGMHYELAVVQ